ncbi:hypothetical protein Hanom_Chr12g01124341 [Helianthus anomalus]
MFTAKAKDIHIAIGEEKEGFFCRNGKRKVICDPKHHSDTTPITVSQGVLRG